MIAMQMFHRPMKKLFSQLYNILRCVLLEAFNLEHVYFVGDLTLQLNQRNVAPLFYNFKIACYDQKITFFISNAKYGNLLLQKKRPAKFCK